MITWIWLISSLIGIFGEKKHTVNFHALNTNDRYKKKNLDFQYERSLLVDIEGKILEVYSRVSMMRSNRKKEP